MSNNINLYTSLLDVFSYNNNNNNNNYNNNNNNNNNKYKYDYFYKIPFNIENYPISIEQIISDHKGIKEEFKCPICFNFVYNPKKCSKCENIFCLNCIDFLNLNFDYNKCPFNCEYPDYIEIDRKLKNILNSTEISCCFKKNGCNKIILYENYENHCKKCEYCDYKCSAENCEFKGNLEQIQKHIFNCDKRYKICKRCNMKLDVKSFDKHFNEDCEFIEIECNKCHFMFLKNNFYTHSEENCLNNQIFFWNRYFTEKKKILGNNIDCNNLIEYINNIFD